MGSTALVLSAGGMFGAWQAGVWQALASEIDVDIVVGASAGALNGWRIACGCSPESLADEWLTVGDHGLLAASALRDRICAMCSEAQPVKHLGVVATELPSGRLRTFRFPDAGWQHIAASCAVPGVLRPERIGGRWYVDGGILDPLPVRAALEMGAETIFAVNALEHRPAWVDLGLQALHAVARYSVPVIPAGVRVVRVAPSQRLGSALDAMRWSRANAERWIRIGQEDGARALRLWYAV